MSRPILQIKLLGTDYFLEIAGWVLLAYSFWFTWNSYAALPETIPVHFDTVGRPDGFGSRSSAWWMPVISLLMYAGLIVLSRYPHLYNYPLEITQENAARQYRLASRFIRIIALATAVLFVVIQYITVMVAEGRSIESDAYVIPVIILAGYGLPFVVYLIIANRELT